MVECLLGNVHNPISGSLEREDGSKDASNSRSVECRPPQLQCGSSNGCSRWKRHHLCGGPTLHRSKRLSDQEDFFAFLLCFHLQGDLIHCRIKHILCRGLPSVGNFQCSWRASKILYQQFDSTPTQETTPTWSGDISSHTYRIWDCYNKYSGGFASEGFY